MKSYDAFSNLSWGNLSRYKEKNDSTIRQERASELDKRILSVANAQRTIQWASSTVDFCNREESQNKDVFSLSSEAYRIPEMKKEAQLILSNEKSRIDTEHKTLAAKTDEIIQNLSSVPRNLYWANEVINLDSDIQSMPRESRVLLKKLSMLQEFIKEANFIKEADSVDAEILKLLRDANKNNDWITKVDNLQKRLTPKIISLLKEKDAHTSLKNEYNKAIRKPIFSKYSQILSDVEGGKWKSDAVRTTFGSLNAELKNHKFSMDEYINEFSSRWATAKATVDAENQRIIDEAAARKKAEQHAKNMDVSRPYLAVLTQVEAGKASIKSVRDEFEERDLALKSITFSMNSCIDNFSQRWLSAKALVASAKAETLRAEREARAAEERRLREEERRRQIEEAAIRERERKARAAAARRKAITGVFLAILGYLIPVAVMFLSLLFCAKFDNYWYAPLMVAISTLVFIHITEMEEDTIYSIYNIFGQVIIYLATIGIFLLLDYGIFNMVVSLALSAVTINLYPKLLCYTSRTMRMVQAGICVVIVPVSILGLDLLLPHLLASLSESAYWHTMWVVPLVIATLFVLTSIALRSDYDDDAEVALMVIVNVVLGMCALIKGIIWLCFFVPFSFGMFFFIVLLIIASVAAWAISLGVMIKVFDLVV